MLSDDASVVGVRFALQLRMAEKSLEARISDLEAELGHKSLQEHFREQAELIDRRFADSFRKQAELVDRRLMDGFREQAELIDRLFVYRFEELEGRVTATLDRTLDTKVAALEAGLAVKSDARLDPIRRDLAVIKHAVKMMLTRLG